MPLGNVTDMTQEERDTAARARSGLDAARVAVDRAEINLLRTRIVAPFPGRVANLKVVPGQYVNVGDELLTVQAMDPIGDALLCAAAQTMETFLLEA